MKKRPNPVYQLPRKRSRRKTKPIMVTVQQVCCKACKRTFELFMNVPANFCIWCRSDNIQVSTKIRRETPAERKQREIEINLRMFQIAGRVLGDLFGFHVAQPGFDPQPPPGIRNGGSALEAELLKEGYRRLAIKYHPDKGGDPEKMKELNRLKEKLGL